MPHGVQANGGLLSQQIGESLAHERYLWSGDYDKSPEHACPAADVLLQVSRAALRCEQSRACAYGRTVLSGTRVVPGTRVLGCDGVVSSVLWQCRGTIRYYRYPAAARIVLNRRSFGWRCDPRLEAERMRRRTGGRLDGSGGNGNGAGGATDGDKALPHDMPPLIDIAQHAPGMQTWNMQQFGGDAMGH